MSAFRSPVHESNGLDQLRVELPDLAYDLERQGRLDAADVVMMLHARVRELSARPDQTDQTGRPAANLQTISIPHQSHQS